MTWRLLQANEVCEPSDRWLTDSAGDLRSITLDTRLENLPGRCQEIADYNLDKYGMGVERHFFLTQRPAMGTNSWRQLKLTQTIRVGDRISFGDSYAKIEKWYSPPQLMVADLKAEKPFSGKPFYVWRRIPTNNDSSQDF